jgi:UDP-N-acetylglucosamine 2-epimerase (non-hydrolysing)
VLVLVGTRPEAVKLAPVVHEARRREDVDVRIVGSGQHSWEMLEVLGHFDLELDDEVAAYADGQSLADITTAALSGFAQEMAAWPPDVVVVQGDTSTAFAGALAAFYAQLPLAHVEAGLRTHSRREPFPEEMNRRLIDSLATFLFPPTPVAALNLALEGHVDEVFLTGNTIVDALRALLARGRPAVDGAAATYFDPRWEGRVLVTAHRRENWGTPMDEIARALARVGERFPGHLFLLPLHPNPIVRRSFSEVLLPSNLVVVDPLPYAQFIALLEGADFLVTDSGGALEEATALGRPTLILRNRTERPEAVAVGAATVVGVEQAGIETAVTDAVLNGAEHAPPLEVFGDGQASRRTVDWLRWRYGLIDESPAPFAGGEVDALMTMARSP